jgi:hypothetical protein
MTNNQADVVTGITTRLQGLAGHLLAGSAYREWGCGRIPSLAGRGRGSESTEHFNIRLRCKRERYSQK